MVRSRVASVVAILALSAGMTLAVPAAASANTYGCVTKVTHLSVTSNEDGRWVAATANVQCKTAPPVGYSHIQLGITRNGKILTLVPNSLNQNGWPAQYRDCTQRASCTISVAARAASPAATYKAWAEGWVTQGAGCCAVVAATRSLYK